MPEPPEIMAMVTVKCVNEKAGHEEKAYEVNTGDYSVLNGGVVEVDGTYQYVINLLNSRYLSAYDTDTGAEHKLAENKATEVKFVYEKKLADGFMKTRPLKLSARANLRCLNLRKSWQW